MLTVLFSKKHAAWAFRCGIMGSLMGILASGVPVLLVTCLSTAGIVAGTVCWSLYWHLTSVMLAVGYVTHAVRDAYWFPDKVCLPWIKYLRIGVGVVSVSSLGEFPIFPFVSTFKTISLNVL